MQERAENQNSTHRARVYTLSLNMKPIDEGEAEIMEKISDDGLHLVRFDDGITAECYID